MALHNPYELDSFRSSEEIINRLWLVIYYASLMPLESTSLRLCQDGLLTLSMQTRAVALLLLIQVNSLCSCCIIKLFLRDITFMCTCRRLLRFPLYLILCCGALDTCFALVKIEQALCYARAKIDKINSSRLNTIPPKHPNKNTFKSKSSRSTFEFWL